MALTPEQQLIETVGRSKHILVLGKADGGVATASAVAALLLFLDKQGKRADAVMSGFDGSKAPKFLKNGERIQPALGAVRTFELKVDVRKSPLDELVYDVNDGMLTVSLVPTQGEWAPKDVSFRHGEDRYDLIIALDAPDLPSLGKVFNQHADLIYRLPVINIDSSATNEHWGQINLVDLTAVASGEILYRLFAQWDRTTIDADLATALLAGMIAKTQSFRTNSVTPRTLQTSSELVALGARREDIVHGLWRTKSIPMLRLWGKTLSRLEQDRERGLVWASLTRQDFIEAGASEGALDGIVDELLAYAPEAKVIALIHEHPEDASSGICVSVHATAPHSAHELARSFGGNGSRERVNFCLTPGISLMLGGLEVVKRLQDSLDASR